MAYPPTSAMGGPAGPSPGGPGGYGNNRRQSEQYTSPSQPAPHHLPPIYAAQPPPAQPNAFGGGYGYGQQAPTPLGAPSPYGYGQNGYGGGQPYAPAPPYQAYQQPHTIASPYPYQQQPPPQQQQQVQPHVYAKSAGQQPYNATYTGPPPAIWAPPHANVVSSGVAGASAHDGPPPPYEAHIPPSRRVVQPNAVTYPAIVATDGTHFPVTRMSIDANCQISTAIVTINAEYTCPSNTAASFHLPTNIATAVTNVNFTIGEKVYETAIVSRDDCTAMAAVDGADGTEGAYDPDTFRVPIPDPVHGQPVTVTISYIEPMQFTRGTFTLAVPCTYDKQYNDRAIDSIRCVIHSATPNCQWGCVSHPLSTLSQSPRHVELESSGPMHACDFIISYSVSTPEILGSIIYSRPHNEEVQDQRPAFTLFLSPPSSPSYGVLPRAVVFCIDVSYSMGGKPIARAREALQCGISCLKPCDWFSIIAFDHEMNMWQPQCMPATEQNLSSARMWVEDLVVTGLTDMLKPCRAAVSMLNAEGMPPTRSMFFITDGAVANESEIVEFLRGQSSVRVFTFGIGRCVNSHFLRLCALFGRGVSDVAFFAEKVAERVAYLFDSYAEPVLTDIKVTGVNVRELDLMPTVAPDLFKGAPVLVAGRFSGRVPKELTVTGTLADNKQFSLTIPVEECDVDVSVIWVKQRLDYYVAMGDFTGDEQYRQDAIELSIDQGVPSAHTTMVAYAPEPSKHKKHKKKPRTTDEIVVLAVAGGAGVLVLGAAMYYFGDVAGTTNNVSSVIDSLDGGLFPRLDFLSVDLLPSHEVFSDLVSNVELSMPGSDILRGMPRVDFNGPTDGAMEAGCCDQDCDCCDWDCCCQDMDGGSFLGDIGSTLNDLATTVTEFCGGLTDCNADCDMCNCGGLDGAMDSCVECCESAVSCMGDCGECLQCIGCLCAC